MKWSFFGSTGASISRLGIGGWQAGGSGPWGAGPSSNDDYAIAAIRRAIQGGVNWVDTAAGYGLGHSEEVVARALGPFRVGEDVFVFTKCGHPWDPPDQIRTDLRPDSIRRECEGSLIRLGVERIDLYQFHHPDPSTPIEESWGAMADLVDEGKVRWAGVSNFDLELLQKCENIRHVDCVQPELNLLRRQARQTVIPWCRSHGSAVIVYSPAASGLLTGGTDRQRLELLSAEDWRRASADRILELLERLKAISDRWGTPVGALAVAWTLAVPGVSGAICGARRPGQVEGWIPAGDIELDLATAAQIDSVVAALDF